MYEPTMTKKFEFVNNGFIVKEIFRLAVIVNRCLFVRGFEEVLPA